MGTNARAGDEADARMKATQAAERTIDEAVMIGGLIVAGLVLLEMVGYCECDSLALMRVNCFCLVSSLLDVVVLHTVAEAATYFS